MVEILKKEDYPLVINANHITEILGISKRMAYRRMEENDFPTIQIGRSKYVNRDDFFEWLEQKKVKRGDND